LIVAAVGASQAGTAGKKPVDKPKGRKDTVAVQQGTKTAAKKATKAESSPKAAEAKKAQKKAKQDVKKTKKAAKTGKDKAAKTEPAPKKAPAKASAKQKKGEAKGATKSKQGNKKKAAGAAPAKKAAAKPAPAKKKAVAPPKSAPAEAKPASAGAGQGDMEVARAAVCTAVVKHEPQGSGTEFAASAGKLYCFTHIKGAQDSTQIVHKWFRGDKLISIVPLPVKSSSWRTYSAKEIPAEQGDEAWKVEVYTAGEDGKLLETVSFTVR
jgi:hypothetical protein